MRSFLSFDEYFKNLFGEKVAKLSLDGGFTCPNRDGLISRQGCLFCSERGAGDFAADPKVSIKEQIKSQKELLSKKWKAKKFIAYFQNFTASYGPIEKLEKIYQDALMEDSIIGLAISARADTITDDFLELLEKLNKKTFLWLELGLQSVNEKSISLINRGYSHEVFDEKIKLLKAHDIKFLYHIIYGLPGENRKDFLNSLAYVNKTLPFGVKFHSLYIQTDSKLYNYYLSHPFKLLTKDEYVDIVCESIEKLDKRIVIHRVTGDPNREKLFLPLWTRDKLSVIASIDKNLKLRRKKEEV